MLGDPQTARNIGAAAVELNAFHLLKVMLRAVGSPQLVYSNLPRTGEKFTWTHRMEVVSIDSTSARIRYVDTAGVGYHVLDCQYNKGLLAAVPTMFGAMPATVRHPECALRGGSSCVYEMRWSEEDSALVARKARMWTALSGAAAGGELVAGRPGPPGGEPLVPALGTSLMLRQALRERKQQQESLSALMRDQYALGKRLFASLRDLVGELRVEEVLDKIVENAQAAIAGREFVLLVATDQGLRCRSSSDGVPEATVRLLETWANDTPGVLASRVEYSALEAVPRLASIASDDETPLGALHSSPLQFRGNTMGALIALAHGRDGFDPLELEMLRAYGDQAAIALANARLFARVEDMARRDSLTGLLNSREFEREIVRQIRHVEHADSELAIVMLDLDGFKLVNDQLGHAEGDRVLKEVAEAIESACPPRGTAYRLGGDEFALVLPGTTKEHASELARGVQTRVNAVRAPVTLSWGVAVWPEDGPSPNLLTFNADRALYEHKARHRGAKRGAPMVPQPQNVHLTALAGIDPRDHYLRMLATTLARAVDAKDSYTRSHSETVSELCELISRELDFDEDRVAKAALAGLLHDVGKIGVPDSILQKPSSLTDEEYAVMQTHTTLGHKIVAGAELAEAATWILHHHERIDGRGYPAGLTGDEIPLESRIILVADAFEAMISDRPYRQGRPVAAALAELERHAGSQFDTRCVQALRRVLGSGARELFAGTPSDSRAAVTPLSAGSD